MQFCISFMGESFCGSLIFYCELRLLVSDQPSAFMLTTSNAVVLYNVWPLNPTINLLTLSVIPSSEVSLWCHYYHQPSKGFGQRHHPSLWPKQLQIAQVLTFFPPRAIFSRTITDSHLLAGYLSQDLVKFWALLG